MYGRRQILRRTAWLAPLVAVTALTGCVTPPEHDVVHVVTDRNDRFATNNNDMIKDAGPIETNNDMAARRPRFGAGDLLGNDLHARLRATEKRKVQENDEPR